MRSIIDAPRKNGLDGMEAPVGTPERFRAVVGIALPGWRETALVKQNGASFDLSGCNFSKIGRDGCLGSCAIFRVFRSLHGIDSAHRGLIVSLGSIRFRSRDATVRQSERCRENRS